MIKHLLKTATVKSWQRSTKKETLYKNAFRYLLLKGLKLIQFTFIYIVKVTTTKPTVIKFLTMH